MKKKLIYLIFFFPLTLFAQYKTVNYIPAAIDFSFTLQDWDGFGFNYVETAQTKNYETDPQDYGGFSLMDQKTKNEIIEHVFGEEGLKPGVVKMFLDPWHQPDPDGPFYHDLTTSNMQEFVKMGLEKNRERGNDLRIITTLYGPPAWATQQKFLRGRDLDPDMKEELALYMIDWAKHLREKEIPVEFISLHNEGEDWLRWPRDAEENYMHKGHDYNLWWTPELVNEFINMMTPMIEERGIANLSVTNGECSNWFRFNHWGYASSLYKNEKALENLGLITSHGFYGEGYHYWYGNHASFGIDLLRSKRPDLHAWVTSSSWAKMDAHFIRQIYGSIYDVKINAFIPWAGIQRPPLWVGGDPNPGNAIQVAEDGSYELRDGFYFYKQVSRAGQPGMKVALTSSLDSEANIIAFSSNGTEHPDAFVVINTNLEGHEYGDDFSFAAVKKLKIEIAGSVAKKFKAYRTDGASEFYKPIGEFEVKNGFIEYEAPLASVTTFFAVD